MVMEDPNTDKTEEVVKEEDKEEEEDIEVVREETI
jgi:hypothetical protein